MRRWGAWWEENLKRRTGREAIRGTCPRWLGQGVEFRIAIWHHN